MKEAFPFELLPKPVDEYLGVCRSVTESPDEFLVAGALFAVGALAGSWKMFAGQGLNDYYLLVGSTGTAKKTTAQDLGAELLRRTKKRLAKRIVSEFRDAGEKVSRNEAYPLITHFSVEGLQYGAIGSGTSVGIMVGEYGSLLNIGKRQGQQNTISELTSMYDGQPISVRTVNRVLDVDRYRISMIGGSTVAWLRDFISPKNIGGGFANRHLIFSAHAERIIPTRCRIPEATWNALAEIFSTVVPTDLVAIRCDERTVWNANIVDLQWNPNTESIWQRFYTERVKEMRSMNIPILEECSAREFTHALKLSGLRAVCENRIEVDTADLEFGLRLSRWATRNLVDLAMSGELAPGYDALADRIMRQIQKKKVIRKRELAQFLGGNQERINRCIEHLIVDGQLERWGDGTLAIPDPTSNKAQDAIDKFFGRIGTYPS